MVVSAGWWLLAVALWPVDSRPYIGGSTNNSPLELAFGYNGLGRIFGGEGNGGGAGARRWPVASPAAPRPPSVECPPGGCRPAAAEWAASAARPGSPGCSTARSAARSPGCCPPP